MEIQDAVRACFKKYVDFQGEATRAECWFVLFIVVGALPCQ